MPDPRPVGKTYLGYANGKRELDEAAEFYGLALH